LESGGRGNPGAIGTQLGSWNVPRSIWKGSISFGLVNAPVAMYAAIDEQDLHFHMIHTKDDSPIGYDKVCKEEESTSPIRRSPAHMS
jgi:non-homologous end joining protein Ku